MIADNGPPTVVYVDVLDADKLLPAITQAAENLHLRAAVDPNAAINLDTAQTPGLTVPPSLLAIADEVIE